MPYHAFHHTSRDCKMGMDDSSSYVDTFDKDEEEVEGIGYNMGNCRNFHKEDMNSIHDFMKQYLPIYFPILYLCCHPFLILIVLSVLLSIQIR